MQRVDLLTSYHRLGLSSQEEERLKPTYSKFVMTCSGATSTEVLEEGYEFTQNSPLEVKLSIDPRLAASHWCVVSLNPKLRDLGISCEADSVSIDHNEMIYGGDKFSKYTWVFKSRKKGVTLTKAMAESMFIVRLYRDS